jgi:hypothetical protein
MVPANDVVAACGIVLIGPAILFVAALVVRQAAAPDGRPARTAERIVTWYAMHPQLSLWVLLLLLPLSSFMLGSATLLRTWVDNPHLQDKLLYWAWRAMEETQEHWPAVSVGGATLVSLALLVMITAHLFQSFDRPARGR